MNLLSGSTCKTAPHTFHMPVNCMDLLMLGSIMPRKAAQCPCSQSEQTGVVWRALLVVRQARPQSVHVA